MSAQIPAEALQLRSLVRADQTLELFLDTIRFRAGTKRGRHQG